FPSIAVSGDGTTIVSIANNDNSPTRGRLFISTDYGKSWVIKNANANPTANFLDVAVSNDGQVILVANDLTTNDAMSISIDGGNTFKIPKQNWIKPNSNQEYSNRNDQYINSIAVSSDGSYYICAFDAGPIYLFDPTNNAFNNLTELPDFNNWFGCSCSSDGLHAAVVSNGPDFGIFVSNDTFATWSNPISDEDSYTGIMVSQNGKTMVACAESGNVYLSTNYGKQWTIINIRLDINDSLTSVAMSSQGDNVANSYIYISSWTNLLKMAIDTGFGAIALGQESGKNYQGLNSIAIGNSAGQNYQGIKTIAIGNSAGQDNQLESAIAIGNFAGKNTQGANSIAIGVEAGLGAQGINAIAIG
ncbi:MAG: WD40 repeat domain-containing protein, partial [Alphaproteobacteria bacterium]|nr:WD40 repeat domain-containing protein [Alphaproteobacteria bacterium]